jgi:hypothetical protein
MKKLIIGTVVLILIISCISLVGINITQAQGSDSADILKKLDDVIAGQKAILDSLASMKEELNIIKIRITQQQ